MKSLSEFHEDWTKTVNKYLRKKFIEQAETVAVVFTENFLVLSTILTWVWGWFEVDCPTKSENYQESKSGHTDGMKP